MANAGTFVKGQKRPNQGKRGPAKATIELKGMILAALDGAGGVDYLQRQADESPAAFLSLIGKVLPTTLAADGSSGASLKSITVKFG